MTGLTTGGGVGSYVRRISEAQRRDGHEVVWLDRGAATTTTTTTTATTTTATTTTTTATTTTTGAAAAGGSGAIILGQEAPLVVTRDDEDLLWHAGQLRLDVLHLHTLVCASSFPVPTLRTMHGHWPYCPSGSRFLKRWDVPCPRKYSLFGCAWGHVVDHCGSVRPARFAEDFRRTWAEYEHLSGLRVLAVSSFVREQMLRSGYREELIEVLHLPAPRIEQADTSPRPAEGPPRFAFLGRLVAEKGAAWLIRAVAVAAAAAARTPVAVDIAGDGPELPRLRALADRLRVGDRVRFHGWLDEPAVFALLAAARAVMIPSVWHEPAGLVTLEAAAAGRAVIASSVGGIPEYAQATGNAVLVRANDVAGLAAAIERLARDAPMARLLGETGRARTRGDGPLGMTAHLTRLYAAYAGVMNAGAQLRPAANETSTPTTAAAVPDR